MLSRILLLIALLVIAISGKTKQSSEQSEVSEVVSTSVEKELEDSTKLSRNEEKAVKKAEKEAEKVLKEAEEAKKNLRFSFLAGPGYNPDYGFLVGGSFLFTFKTDTADTVCPRSVLPVAFSLMSSGGINFFSKSTLFFKEDRFRIYPEFYLSTLIKNYYGVGYEMNKNTDASDSTTVYRENLLQLKPSFAFRLGSTNLFTGPIIDFSRRTILDPAVLMQTDSTFIAQGGDSTGDDLWNVGLGFLLQYDTRDFPANAYNGLYLDGKVYGYFSFLGSTQQFGVVELEYRQYKELPIVSKRKVFAWNVKMRQTFGSTPWTDLSTVGSVYDLRGYPLGQYRDAGMLYGLAEYRHMFNAGSDTKAQKFWSKWGVVGWGGIAGIGPAFYQLEGALPNYGLGIRFELQPRMNFRMDFGRDPIGNEMLFYMNVTEAF